ncbi:unnamed protein product [Ectocarpus sp. 8 AP-2014]
MNFKELVDDFEAHVADAGEEVDGKTDGETDSDTGAEMLPEAVTETPPEAATAPEAATHAETDGETDSDEALPDTVYEVGRVQVQLPAMGPLGKQLGEYTCSIQQPNSSVVYRMHC